MHTRYLRSMMSGNFATAYPFLPAPDDGAEGGGGGTGTGAAVVAPPAAVVAPPAAVVVTPPADPAEGPNGYPLDTKPELMKPEHQAAYWRAVARKQEGRAKESFEWRKANEDKVKGYDALEEASRTESEKAIAKATEAGVKTGRESAMSEARLKFGAETVRSRLDAAATAKGMTGAALATLAGDPTRFLGDEGVDADALTAFLDALPDAKKGSSGPTGLGAGNRPPVAAVSGADLYNSRHSARKA